MQLRNKNKIFFLSGLLALALSLNPVFAYADAKADLEAQKTAKQQQLAQLNQQIQALQGQINDTRKKSASLQNEINLFNIEILSTQIQIQATQTNIDNTNIQITETKLQIADKTTQISQEKNVLAQLLASLNQYDNSSALQLGLSSNNFSDLLDQVQYTESLQSKVFSILQQIKDLKQKLENDQIALQKNLDSLNKLNAQLSATETVLNDQRASKAQLLSQTKGQESKYQKLLSTSQGEQNSLNQEIINLDNQISGKKGFSKQAAVHGLLAWPMDGVITQGYGNTGFTRLGYTFHNGIDIAAPAGTPIYAAADGTVFATGMNDNASFGNWVAIKHNIQGHGLVTLYGHMIRFIVSTGQSIRQGDLVGYEGNTGNTTRLLYGPEHGYHLHFGVYDANGFGVTNGAYSKTYGPYTIPYGATYSPYDFL